MIRTYPRFTFILVCLAILAIALALITSPARAVVPRADLSIRLASTDLTPDTGQQVIGRAEFRNFGPDAATDATLTVNFAGYTFDGFCTPRLSQGVLTCAPIATPANCTVGADSFTCTYATVESGTRIVYGFRATYDSGPDGTRFSGDIASITKDPNLTNNHALAQPTLP